MAKGFSEQNKQGFALLLIPSANAYAAERNLDLFPNSEENEPFIGVTNMLEQAQIWKTKQQAKDALTDYIPWLIEQLLDSDEAQLSIQIVEIVNKKGKLKSQMVEELSLMKESKN